MAFGNENEECEYGCLIGPSCDSSCDLPTPSFILGSSGINGDEGFVEIEASFLYRQDFFYVGKFPLSTTVKGLIKVIDYYLSRGMSTNPFYIEETKNSITQVYFGSGMPLGVRQTLGSIGMKAGERERVGVWFKRVANL